MTRDPAPRRFDIIINARSGTPGKEAIAAQVTARLSALGHEARLTLARTGSDLTRAVAAASGGDADAIVAGGGDGTIAGVAAAVLDAPKALGVLPLGTFNFFARRMGVPMDIDAAIDVLATGVPSPVTVGEVNGRVFLNNSSIGMYPAVLQRRENTYRQVGRSRAAAYLSVALVLVRSPRYLHLQLSADGAPLVRRTPLLFVAANDYQIDAFDMPGAECVADGKFAAYVTRPLASIELWRLALRGFFRGLYGAGELELVCARELHVTLRGKRVRVALDGEIAKLRAPLRYRMRQDALRVLVPR